MPLFDGVIDSWKNFSQISELCVNYQWLKFGIDLGPYTNSFLFMGNSDSKADNLQQHEPSPLTPTLLEQAQRTSPRMHKIAQNIIQHCKSQMSQQIQSQIKNISYDLPSAPLPLCLKNIDDCNFACDLDYECRTCYGVGVTLCHSCFETSEHQGHQYALIESKAKNICSCGNKEVTEKTVSCKNHALMAPMESQQIMNLFKAQLKFLFDLVFLLRDRPLDPKISKEKLVYFAKILMQHSTILIKNNNIGSKLIYDVLMEYPSSLEQQIKKNEKTIFQEIVYYSEDEDMVPYLETIINSIIRTDANKTGIIQLYYTFLMRADSLSQVVVSMFQKMPIKPSVFPISYQKYFENLSFPLFITIIDCNDFDLVTRKYNSFLKELTSLLLHPKKQGILMKIFQHTSICQILNYELYYLNNNQAKESILELGNKFTLFVSKVIKIMKEHEKGNFLFQKMIIECFSEIRNRKSQTFNRSYERIFAMLSFELYNHSIPSKQQLNDLLGIHSHQAIIEIILHFIEFRALFHEQYHSFIVNKNTKNNGETILELIALDDYFLKIMCNYLEQVEIQQLYKIYIHQKFGDNLPEKDTVMNFLGKTAEFLQVFAVSLPSLLSELMLEANSQIEGKSSFIILSNLSWILENTDSSAFKAIAQKFIEKQENIINFIKNQIAVQNKKIKFKAQQQQFPIFFSPDSPYLNENLQTESFEKMLSRKQKPKRNESFDVFFQQKMLKDFIHIWESCSEIVLNVEIDKKKCPKEILATLTTLCNIYLLNQSPSMISLIQKYSQKVASPPPKLQVYLKTLLSETVDSKKKKMELLKDKKKMRNQQLKAKQMAALNTYKVQENTKIDLECIFCKNSEEGEPYLLGHFKYNNFYSKKILQMDVPFMQFTTCGHSAHEKCLRQMHKGEFRIWYPCIFCKSITNMLLPWATSELSNDRRFEKILQFLKNFAATYTFFFQEQKGLVEFGPNDVSGVYRMLIKTLVYSLTIYPIVNREYFQQKQFPILKFIYDLLVFTQKRLKNLTFDDKYPFKAKNDLTNIFHYHHYQLEFFIMNNYNNFALQKKIDQYRDNFSEELAEMYDQIYQNLLRNKETFQCQLKDTTYEDMIKGHIYKPPQDLSDLRQLRMKCKSCSTQSQKFEVCLLCEYSCCSSCLDVRKVHAVEQHLGESVFLNGYTGSYSYLHEGLTGQFSSIYVDYLGNEATNKKSIKSEQFTLNDTKWAKVVNDIVCDRLHKEVYRLKG